MAGEIDEQSVVAVAAPYRLQWEDAQQSWVLLYPEGMVTLNDSASEILRRCDGTRTVGDIIADLDDRYPDAGVAADTVEFLGIARDRGWLHVQ